MAKYDVSGLFADKFPFLCEVVAADGQSIPGVVLCDTETGFVTRFARNDTGNLLLVFDALRRRPVPARVGDIYPAPLRLIPIGGDAAEDDRPVVIQAQGGNG